MVVKIYVSGISGNKEVKKRQQRVLMILDSKNVTYDIIDITEPGKEDEKEFMQGNSTARNSKHPLPPQIFNDEDYCGDYEDFDLANETDKLEEFLKINESSAEEMINDNNTDDNNVRQNGNASSREASTDKDVSVAHSESEMNEQQNSTVDEGAEKSNPNDESAKSLAEDDVDDMDDSADKNEEKSDDQEKEE